MKLLAATGNKHKIKEISRILSPLGYEIVSPGEMGIDIDLIKTITTVSKQDLDNYRQENVDNKDNK